MTMKSTGSLKAFLWFGLIVGIGLMIWSVWTVNNYNNLKDNGITTQATITEITSITYKRGIPSKRGYAVYKDENGGEHQFEGYLGDYVETGDQITIIYNRDDPDEVVRENSWISIILWISGGMLVFFGGMLVLLIFFKIDKKSVSCRHQDVSPSELARIIREYMPQTRSNFLRGRGRNRTFDRLGVDPAMERSLDMGDPVKQIYKNYKTIMSSDEIRLGAVIRATERDIYSEMSDMLSDAAESGRARHAVPAFMVYSRDDYFNSEPAKLIEIANRLTGAGYGFVPNENDAQLISFLSDNTSRPFGLTYSSEMTFGREVTISTVVLSKHLLCNKRLSNRLLYLVVSGNYAAIVPAWYYSMWELSAF